MRISDLVRKWRASLMLVAFVMVSFLVKASSKDSLLVKDASIVEFYAFQSPTNTNYVVFVVNVPDFYAVLAGTSLEGLKFQINVDNSILKDNVEDLVILATLEKGIIKVYSPASPEQIKSRSVLGADLPVAEISLYGNGGNQPQEAGINAFVSHKEDHFYLDLDAFRAILGGTFSTMNNMWNQDISLVIEVPKSILSAGTTINAWATSNARL